MNYAKNRIAYVVADLKRIGPTNQTLNIIRYSGAIQNCVVITLFDESNDTQIQEYLSLGIEVLCLHLSRKTILLNGVDKLSHNLKETGASLVHSWGTFADIVSHYACKKLHMKHMITLRNFPVEEMTTRMKYWVGMAVAKFDLHILKNCSHVVCCSNSIKKKMEDAYHWTHLKSIQNGVDFSKFCPYDRKQVRHELGVDEQDVIFIATGSMIPRKHIDETAEAFLMANLPDHYRLWFLGEGNLLEGFRKKYAQRTNIVFWGKQTDVAKFLSAADVFVSSSESEGMPNAVLEALACGLPVYLSDIPQHMEVLENVPGCGKAYPLGMHTMLAELFQNTTDEEIQIMHDCAEKILNSDLTMTAMGRKYAEFYEQIQPE